MKTKKYTARWERPFYDYNEETGREEEIYSEVDEKEFDDFSEAVEWLGDKDYNSEYYCVVWRNDTGRVCHVGWLA